MVRNFVRNASRDIGKDLARAAVPFRWISLVSTLIVIAVTRNNVSSTEWSSALTAAGAVLGVYGAWLTLEIFRIGDKFGQQQQKLIEEVHSTVMAGTKIQHFQELRRKYQDAKAREDNEATAYWHFIWRFETYDFLGLALLPRGHARIRIIGLNNPPLEMDYERLMQPIYTIDVIEAAENESLHTGRAYCWCVNGRLFIGNEANEIELLNPAVEFEIVGLGPPRGGAVGRRPPNFKRLKDLRDPSSGNQDQGD